MDLFGKLCACANAVMQAIATATATENRQFLKR
jgi:hypothetical protein